VSTVSILPDETGVTTESALDGVIRLLETAWLPAPPPEVSNFRYWPVPIPLFLAGIDALRDAAMLTVSDAGNRGQNNLRVVDLGCGIGTVLALMWQFGLTDLTGVEWFPQYAAVARVLCPPAKIIVGDIHDQDALVASADIVYTYRPYRGQNDDDYNDWLVATMLPGALLWTPQGSPKGCDHLGGWVYEVTA
jgi:hypothetical protein